MATQALAASWLFRVISSFDGKLGKVIDFLVNLHRLEDILGRVPFEVGEIRQ